AIPVLFHDYLSIYTFLDLFTASPKILIVLPFPEVTLRIFLSVSLNTFVVVAQLSIRSSPLPSARSASSQYFIQHSYSLGFRHLILGSSITLLLSSPSDSSYTPPSDIAWLHSTLPPPNSLKSLFGWISCSVDDPPVYSFLHLCILLCASPSSQNVYLPQP
ncbi:hypothetical protein SK128_015563, partial [Halocaridina rubra]